tara:strand:- start:457 stop:588 length:132 start_codon:yes stop_codon:yes gene_type:complete
VKKYNVKDLEVKVDDPPWRSIQQTQANISYFERRIEIHKKDRG